ncbi:MAG: glutamate synthase subunit beta [Kiritimatiellia bacterium]|jgi:glutamate synthase (NADPH/NADH) small chain|nr:glutamate synthase subunit beta [Kiritimatiellia bacterium]MDP6629885.1 glutamate synthase subunit beta [Kiritimatiellia bacterium]MDP6809692.1 glutamate synthase subunit beta [Kiritimatiellia bacterium]MDP7025198.1 glutamate synthase subunit beta [Kiritimatiellia bacterium]
MGKERGFMEIERRDPGYRPVEERVKDYRAVERQFSSTQLVEQATRCMDCGIPFCCSTGCPLANVIPEFNDLVYKERWQDALDMLLLTNPFPEFTGRICPAPCETSCTLGINRDPVAIRQIEVSIVENAFRRGLLEAEPPSRRHDARIAVVGSGPAGLATADVLNRHGYNVVVFEKNRYPGGLLRYGIPDFKLEKWVVERRIKLMEDEGVVFETGVDVGLDLSSKYLLDRFDAVVLSAGAEKPRDLPIPGRDLEGIHFAMDFLSQQNRRISGEEIKSEEISARDKHVIVIGGGDTGSDCVGTSNRQGATGVTQLEILAEPPENRPAETPWPLWPLSRRDSSSHKEGCERRWSVQTEEFVGNQGRVSKLKCCEVEWDTPQDGGRPVPRKVKGSDFLLPADLVFLSMGFTGPATNKLVDDLELQLDPRGNIQRDGDHRTSHPGVFVAGDMTHGASLVVRAINDGVQTARSVMNCLKPTDR